MDNLIIKAGLGCVGGVINTLEWVINDKTPKDVFSWAKATRNIILGAVAAVAFAPEPGDGISIASAIVIGSGGELYAQSLYKAIAEKNIITVKDRL
jgi:hypothetical protein